MRHHNSNPDRVRSGVVIVRSGRLMTAPKLVRLKIQRTEQPVKRITIYVVRTEAGVMTASSIRNHKE